MNQNLHRRALADWRGLPEKRPETDRWQAPADVLPTIMQRLGLKERLQESEIMEAWGKIVGDFIAAHSTPVALHGGILFVRVLQPALHYELEQISKIDILRKLKRRFGGKIIGDVRFRVG
jgi:predicted nucleic acid-binding Zn ribbon protein